MKATRSILALSGMLLIGCRTTHDVAATSFRVIDAPANYVRRHLDRSQETTTTTTTTVASDAVTPGRPVNVASENRDTRRRVAAQSETSPTATPRTSRNTKVENSRPSPTPAQRASGQAQQFPTAKPVPGKPGYVFSPFDPSGGYVDVNGYSSGSKVKDPYSGKIFIVP